MAKRILNPFIFIVLVTSFLQCDQQEEILKGVDQKMAVKRKEHISSISYDLHFDIPEDKDLAIPSSLNLTFTLEGKIKNLQLDFKEAEDHLLGININGHDMPPDFHEEHITIPADFLLAGTNEVSIDFIAGDLSLNRNEEYLYTLLVPARARTLFPVFDQPDLKAEYMLSLTIPVIWEAVANAPLNSEVINGNKKRLKFEKTKPISTYLFAFAAGKFKKWEDTDHTMTMYYRENDSIKVANNAPEIFRLHQSSIAWLEEYTGIPYPFQKFDFALIPTFQYGGMEHPGSIFYRERSLMLDESASINQELSRASLIAHETAHMWFGDLVTMKWFDDVWLKEVFANFMAAKIVHPSFPEINHDLRFLLAHFPRAYDVDRSAGSHPIQQPLANLEDAGSVYGSIIYQKAPIVMRNLEAMVGKEKFREGIREYLETFAYDNATWDDLIMIMDKRTDANLANWNIDWVKQGGMPHLAFNVNNNNVLALNIKNGGGMRKWPQEIRVKIRGAKKDTSIQLNSGTWQTGVDISSIGTYQYPNVDGRSYGYHLLEHEQIEKLQLSLADIQDPVERASAWMMIWESFLWLEPDKPELHSALIAHLATEKNPLILNYLSGISKTLFWNFSDADQRQSVASELERMILKRISTEDDMSVQRTLFQLYTSIATTPASIDILFSMWEGSFKEMSLPLSERDYESLAYALALRLPVKGDSILKEQIIHLSNPDSQKRMQFISPSLSPLKVVRDSVFESLKNPENRGVEPWVSQVLSFLHHPLRQESSLSFIRPGLDLIEEIQQTGDIFFPKSWLDNTLEGHNSSQAAEIVRKFLEERHDLPMHLKNKVLQSSDLLFRSSIKN